MLQSVFKSLCTKFSQYSSSLMSLKLFTDAGFFHLKAQNSISAGELTARSTTRCVSAGKCKGKAEERERGEEEKLEGLVSLSAFYLDGAMPLYIVLKL